MKRRRSKRSTRPALPRFYEQKFILLVKARKHPAAGAILDGERGFIFLNTRYLRFLPFDGRFLKFPFTRAKHPFGGTIRRNHADMHLAAEVRFAILLEAHMTSKPEHQLNAEEVNDRVKLLFHRLIARRLKEDPSLIESARKELELMRERFGDPDLIGEWQELLDHGVKVVRREIVRRTERMTRLRISSPLGVVMDLSDEAFRRRVWRSSREALTRRLGKEPSSDQDVVPIEIIDGVNDFASDDPRSPTSIVRATDVETLIAILEDEYSRPGRAAGPLSTSLEWEEIKRRLTGVDPLDEDISDETTVAAMREARDGKLESVTLEELRAMLNEAETSGGVPFEEIEAKIEAAIEQAERDKTPR